MTHSRSPVPKPAAQRIAYPPTRKDTVADDYHGVEVADPYRWLEDDVRTSSDVREWVTTQNELAFAYLDGIAARDRVRERITALMDHERFSSPFLAGGRYYYFYNDGLQNQSVLYAADSLDGEPEIVLDPNLWSDDGTVALQDAEPSDDGRYMAYARSVAGSDWTEWLVRDMRTGHNLSDHLQWTKFTSVSWNPEGTGFYYCRFDEPPGGELFQALNTHQKVCYHRLGTLQHDDAVVYERPDRPTWGFNAEVSEDGAYLVVSAWEGTDPRNRVFFRRLGSDDAGFVALIDHFDDEYRFLGNDGPVFYFKTTLDAPKGRIIAIDTRDPDPARYREIVGESSNALEGANMTGGLFVATYLADVVTEVEMFDTSGARVRRVPLPGKGSASGFDGKRRDTETFFTYSSFDTPPTIYHYDIASGRATRWKQPVVDFDPADYVVTQVFYPSADGTRIPMFVSHRKDLPLDGDRPTLLYGYGGFSVSLRPGFSVLRLAWMEMGGVYAQVNLRGGGEYGEAWHDAGRLDNKQNVFDDFIAAAEWLIASGYTKSRKLAIEGRSNGGLLVGAAIVQRPDLFGAALPDVGVMDMLRFHHFTAGRYWVDDYGSADDPTQFETLYAYSPYHNLVPARYPPTLVTTADTDDRVVPGHSFKFAARLQEMQLADAPVLIRIETSAGHGAGKPIRKVIEEVSDQYAFLLEHLFEDRVAASPEPADAAP
jgi:prolyl oligopeptidase